MAPEIAQLPIQVAGVDFAYGEDLVVQGMNLEVRQGEFLGIIGPNGGGKTTFLRLLLGLLAPSRGRIRVLGRDPLRCSPPIGYVPQSKLPHAGFPISLMEVVLMSRLHRSKWGWSHSPEDRDAAIEALERVELAQFAQTPFHQLSGGLARRGLIARALCSGFPLLLLDEPTANVDANSQAGISQILQRLKGEITIAMVSHNMSTVIARSDRVLYVDRTGHLIRPQEICEHFAMGLYHPPDEGLT